MAIADQITRIQQAKEDIKNAIENKGVIVGDGTIDTYASKINEISGDESSGTSNIKIDFENYVGGAFYPYNVTEIVLSSPIAITSLNNACANCSKVKKIDFSGLDLSNCTNMVQSFQNCRLLEYLDISTVDFNNSIVIATTTFTEVPDNCLIYVKDQSSKDKLENLIPRFTNIQIKPSA